MTINSGLSLSIVDLVYKRIEIITLRIKTIQSSYEQVTNVNLKNRLVEEHSKLKSKFLEVKPLVLLIKNSSTDKLGTSKLLLEKYLRSKKEIHSDNFLFST